MKLIKNEKLEHSQQELQFSIEPAAFAEAVDKAYKKTCKRYNVPGFRKGKAPRHMIEKMYGEDVFHYDAINDLFPVEYEAAVAEAGIEPVGRPEAEVVSESLTDGVVLKVTVPVKPEVKVGQYTGLEAEKRVHTVEDTQVDAELTRMQDRNARVITREGKAENGDTVDIDFKGMIDGKPFEGGEAEHYSLTLGSNSFIPGFEEQIVGHEAGEEFDIDVKFPEDYQAEELAGKDTVFQIKLHEVKTKEMPELDDDFAKDVSEYDTLDELKKSIREGIEKRNAQQADTEVENTLVDKVIEGMEGEIPEAMYEEQMDAMVRDYEYRLSQQGLKLDVYLQYMNQTREQFRDSFRTQAEKRVKIRLALEEIVKQEGLTASDEEIDAEIKRMAAQYQMEEDKVREAVNMDAMKQDLAVNKAIDLIKDKAKVTEVKVEADKAE